MARIFEIEIGNIEKKTRFDIFGYFTKHNNLSEEEKETLATKTCKEWINANAEKLDGKTSFTVLEKFMRGDKLIVKIEVV